MNYSKLQAEFEEMKERIGCCPVCGDEDDECHCADKEDTYGWFTDE